MSLRYHMVFNFFKLIPTEVAGSQDTSKYFMKYIAYRGPYGNALYTSKNKKIKKISSFWTYLGHFCVFRLFVLSHPPPLTKLHFFAE